MTETLRTARWLWALTLLVIAGIGSTASAETLLAATSLISGSQTVTSAFDVDAPGTLTVHLTDLDWPEKLGSLSFALVNSTTVLTSFTDTGTVSFDVAAPGSFTAIVSGNVQSGSALHLGAYSLQVDFVSQVPVPATGLLLASALAGLLGLAQWRGSAYRSCSADVMESSSLAPTLTALS